MEPAQRDDEIFDVVDAGDRVIGQATRREVHAQELYHRAVHILIFNKAGQIFLQKRSMAKDTHPGCWDSSASGHLGSGEDYHTAAIREFREELGAEAPELERLIKLGPSAANGREFIEVYRSTHSGPLTPNPAEISEGRWFTEDEVDRFIQETPDACASSFIEVWEHYRA
uniref:NTP pyrophosphohydrolases including oxidative damage repair enzymes n=1 Tax=uncultured verrucomicrobium HF0500_27H16 TaxID=723600 RepID=E7C5L5_9BACT|nr:NTP pyrophosphohydrolases including oxidative damage repair enzymes [uncultured verrucomicrobium HF0500_27H16]